jgi:Tfp pilus assembly protein PilO
MPWWRLLLIECAVLTVICGGFYMLRYEASARRYREALNRTSGEIQAVVLQIDVERRALEAAQHRREVLARFVLDKESRARLLSAITDSTVHRGLSFVSISPLPKENLQHYARCRASLTVAGSFRDFLHFLRTLESDGVPCSIVGLDVVSRWDKGKPEWFTFLVETYAEADVEQPRGGPAP